MKKTIFETSNFKAIAQPQPFINRDEGGHIKIVSTNKNVKDKLNLTTNAANRR